MEMEQELFRENFERGLEYERRIFGNAIVRRNGLTIEQSNNDQIAYLRSVIPMIGDRCPIDEGELQIDWPKETRERMINDTTNILGEKLTNKYIN